MREVAVVPPIRLAVCITFHFVAERLGYLGSVLANLPTLAASLDVTIVTNASEAEQQRVLDLAAANAVAVKLFVPTGLGHPYLLPWSHFPVMREKFADPSFTHFLYQEDDLLVRNETVHYLLAARESLRAAGLLPAVLRVEQAQPGGEWRASDVVDPVSLRDRPMVRDPVERIGYINLSACYQGLYFLDRACMEEHLTGPSSSPDFGAWPVRERAAQGLTFSHRPPGYKFRYVVPVDLDTEMVDGRCFVHHLPNSYACDPAWAYGKRAVTELID